MSDFQIDTINLEIEEKLAPRALRQQAIHDPAFFVDDFSLVRRPRPALLVHSFKRIAFVCASLNAYAFAQVPIRLFVKTSTGQKRARCRTRPVSEKEISYLRTIPSLQDKLKHFKDVEEVEEHPALDVLAKVNPVPTYDGFRLKILTQLYQEIVGRAYWFIRTSRPFNIPSEIWPIASHLLEPKKNPKSSKFIDFYEFTGGLTSEKFDPKDIIPFLLPNLTAPYTGGYSWLEAAWEDFKVQNKHIAHELSMLDNEMRPDALLSPINEMGAMDADEAETLEQKLRQKFARGGMSKWIVTNEALKITPLNWAPKDIGRLDIDKRAISMVTIAAGVPLALLFTEDVNKANLEQAREQHALNTISPRLNFYVGPLNEEFLPRYDNTDRLFFGFDDPVPENRELKLQEIVQLKINGIMGIKEARETAGLPRELAVDDELEMINIPADRARQDERDSGTAER